MRKIFAVSIVPIILLLGSEVFAADIVSGQDIYINGSKAEMSAINFNDNNTTIYTIIHFKIISNNIKVSFHINIIY